MSFHDSIIILMTTRHSCIFDHKKTAEWNLWNGSRFWLIHQIAMFSFTDTVPNELFDETSECCHFRKAIQRFWFYSISNIWLL